MRGFVFVFCTVLAAASAASAQQPGPAARALQAQCAGVEDITRDARLVACTAIIDAGNAPPEQLGEAYRERCDLRNLRGDAALADCDRAIALAPTANAYLYRAQVYLNRANPAHRADYDRAIADFTTALSIDPTAASAYARRGEAFAGKGDYDRAIADYTQALALNPHLKGFAGTLRDDAEAAKARVAQGQKRGDLRAWCDGKALPEEGFALDLQVRGCTTLIDSRKESRERLAQDYFNRADARDFATDEDLAIKDFQAALGVYVNAASVPPATAVAYRRLGMIYYVKNDDDNAIAYLDKAVATDPKDTLALSYRGYSLAAKGEYDRAIADYDSVLALKPDNADAYLNRARAYFGKNDFDHAIADADQAIRLSQTSEATEGYELRGDAHFRQRDFRGAIADYGQALTLWSEYPEALYGRGAAKTRNGDAPGGGADIAAARKLKPEIEAAEAKRGIAP